METPALTAVILSEGQSSRIGDFKPLLSLGEAFFLADKWIQEDRILLIPSPGPSGIFMVEPLY